MHIATNALVRATTKLSDQIETDDLENALKDLDKSQEDNGKTALGIAMEPRPKSIEYSGTASESLESMMSIEDNTEEADEATEGNPKLEIYTLSQVRDHDSEEDAWMVIYDRVYDVTKFLQEVTIDHV